VAFLLVLMTTINALAHPLRVLYYFSATVLWVSGFPVELRSDIYSGPFIDINTTTWWNDVEIQLPRFPTVLILTPQGKIFTLIPFLYG
jgi:hypothetical protein